MREGHTLIGGYIQSWKPMIDEVVGSLSSTNTTTTTTNANNSNVLASYGNDHLNTYLYTMENSINHSNSSSNNNNNNNNINIDNDNHNSRHDDNSNTMINSQKAKIVAHPSFPRLLQAYTNYYKVSAYIAKSEI